MVQGQNEGKRLRNRRSDDGADTKKRSSNDKTNGDTMTRRTTRSASSHATSSPSAVSGGETSLRSERSTRKRGLVRSHSNMGSAYPKSSSSSSQQQNEPSSNDLIITSSTNDIMENNTRRKKLRSTRSSDSAMENDTLSDPTGDPKETPTSPEKSNQQITSCIDNAKKGSINSQNRYNGKTNNRSKSNNSNPKTNASLTTNNKTTSNTSAHQRIFARSQSLPIPSTVITTTSKINNQSHQRTTNSNTQPTTNEQQPKQILSPLPPTIGISVRERKRLILSKRKNLQLSRMATTGTTDMMGGSRTKVRRSLDWDGSTSSRAATAGGVGGTESVSTFSSVTMPPFGNMSSASHLDSGTNKPQSSSPSLLHVPRSSPNEQENIITYSATTAEKSKTPPSSSSWGQPPPPPSSSYSNHHNQYDSTNNSTSLFANIGQRNSKMFGSSIQRQRSLGRMSNINSQSATTATKTKNGIKRTFQRFNSLPSQPSKSPQSHSPSLFHHPLPPSSQQQQQQGSSFPQLRQKSLPPSSSSLFHSVMKRTLVPPSKNNDGTMQEDPLAHHEDISLKNNSGDGMNTAFTTNDDGYVENERITTTTTTSIGENNYSTVQSLFSPSPTCKTKSSFNADTTFHHTPNPNIHHSNDDECMEPPIPKQSSTFEKEFFLRTPDNSNSSILPKKNRRNSTTSASKKNSPGGYALLKILENCTSPLRPRFLGSSRHTSPIKSDVPIERQSKEGQEEHDNHDTHESNHSLGSSSSEGSTVMDDFCDAKMRLPLYLMRAGNRITLAKHRSCTKLDENETSTPLSAQATKGSLLHNEDEDHLRSMGWIDPNSCIDGIHDMDNYINTIQGDLKILDWSLKQSLHFECHPRRCIPGKQTTLMKQYRSFNEDNKHNEHNNHPLSSSKHDCNLSAGDFRIERLAMELLSDYQKQPDKANLRANEEEIILAQWKAATMYWQHPATYPLPSAIIKEGAKSANKNRYGNGSKRKTVFGVGDTTQSNNNQPNAYQVALATQNNNGSDPTNVLSASSFLENRDREWMECFRSIFFSWMGRIDDLRMQLEDGDQVTETKDICRFCFYSITPGRRTVLFRAMLRKRDKGSSDSTTIDLVDIIPVIIISSSTNEMRNQLRLKGVTLRIWSDAGSKLHGASEPTDCNYDERIVHDEAFIDSWIQEKYSSTSNDISPSNDKYHDELEELRRAKTVGAEVSVSMMNKRQKDNVGRGSAVLKKFPPIYITGYKDCITFHEFYLHARGKEENMERNGTEIPTMSSNGQPLIEDVPLLICRYLGPCSHMTLRHLWTKYDKVSNLEKKEAAGGKIDEINQDDEGSTNEVQPQLSSLKLYGPVMPCAVQDLTSACIAQLVLDKKMDYIVSNRLREGATIDPSSKDTMLAGMKSSSSIDDEEEESSALGSHYLVLQMQTHNGEDNSTAKGESSSTSRVKQRNKTKMIGCASSAYFNCVDKVDLPCREHRKKNGDEEVIEMAVWDITKPFNVLHKSELVQE